jgi:tape measure domain-containing protein
MAFLGDLVVKMGANVNPFTNALKKAQSMTKTFKDSLSDMRTTAQVFAKLAASIKAVNNQMDRLVNVSKRALQATNIQANAEQRQFRDRMAQLRAMQQMQQRSSGRGMLEVAGGIGIASGAMGAASMVKDIAVSTVKLAADAEVARIQFEVLTGDAARGAKLFKDIEKFASRTSFDLTSAAAATKSLLASGVAEDKVLGTMQLLGDLAMGDAEKLGFLAKAYTDVLNKGKLQAQEIRQFSENGVGLIAALAKTLNKSTTEILSMSEAGDISFSDMQTALQSLTGEGGRFNNMMSRINKTFTGQWNSLIENVQTLGREIGQSVLPQLTAMTTYANEVLQKFTQLPDKMKFLSEVIDASSQVAFEHVRKNWADMLKGMQVDAKSAAGNIFKWFTPGGFSGVMQDKRTGKQLIEDMKKERDKATGRSDAKTRLNELLKQVAPDGNGGAAAAVSPNGFNISNDMKTLEQKLAINRTTQNYYKYNQKNNPAGDVMHEDAKIRLPELARERELLQADMNKLKQQKQKPAATGNGLSDLMQYGKDKLSPLIAGAQQFGQTKVTEWQTWAQGLQGTLANWFGGDEKKKQTKTDAGFMAQGSAEAFQTIIAQMTSTKTPEAAAIDKNTAEQKKNTKEIVKAVKSSGSGMWPVVMEFLT